MELGDYLEATEQLRAREPIVHHAQAGSGREVFEAMIAMDYWEVGASGRVYTRDYVIETLVERYSDRAKIVGPSPTSKCAAWLTTYTLRRTNWTSLIGAVDAQQSGGVRREGGSRSTTRARSHS